MKSSLPIILCLLICSIVYACQPENPGVKKSTRQTIRGVVVYPSDIISTGSLKLVEFMRESEINVLGIHTNTLSENLSDLRSFIESNEGQLLFKECEKATISIEFESHALHELLPRELFDSHPEYFRLDNDGVRKKDYNMCFSSEGAYKEIEKNIGKITKWLKPSTHRYFFWTDDVEHSFCNCDSCKKYSESEQALLFENRLLEMLRKTDSLATLAHLAYGSTYRAPVNVKPAKGIFLEYAPINRDYLKPLSDEHMQNLKENLQVFPTNTAHILEYWLDASMFSKWDRKNLVRVPWDKSSCDRDVKFYTDLGISSITTFGTWMLNSDYFSKYGEDDTHQIVKEYGLILKRYLK
jgi:hypothetical protein